MLLGTVGLSGVESLYHELALTGAVGLYAQQNAGG